MKTKLFILFLMVNQTISLSQTIEIPDANLKLKLSLANVENYHYAKNALNQWIRIDTNGDGEIQQSEALLVTKLYLDYEGIYPTVLINTITGLDYFYNLEYLDCRDNPISTTDLLVTLPLKILYVDSCALTTVNLNGLVSLEVLSCADNNISEIDFSELTSLREVACEINNISSLDFSNNQNFNVLRCGYNNLTNLIIKNNFNHYFSMGVGDNDCWKTGNPNLTNICVDESELASVQSYLNGCDTAQTISIYSSCNLANEEFTKKEVILFPNPAKDSITITSNETIKAIELFDLHGRMLVSKLVNSNQHSLDIVSYSNGIYFLKIMGDITYETVKIIKR